MPITQREHDIMRLQAQITINKMVEDWRRQFLRGRMQEILNQAPARSNEEVEDENAEIYG